MENLHYNRVRAKCREKQRQVDKRNRKYKENTSIIVWKLYLQQYLKINLMTFLSNTMCFLQKKKKIDRCVLLLAAQNIHKYKTFF